MKLAKCRTWSRAVHHDRGLHVLLKSMFYKSAEGSSKRTSMLSGEDQSGHGVEEETRGRNISVGSALVREKEDKDVRTVAQAPGTEGKVPQAEQAVESREWHEEDVRRKEACPGF